MTDHEALGTSIILSEQDDFRISRHTLQPGESTGWHTHEYDYVVVPVSSGSLTIDTSEDRTEFNMRAREPYRRGSGAIHNLTNNGANVVEFIEVEFLT